jgi:serine/threonine protein kinase
MVRTKIVPWTNQFSVLLSLRNPGWKLADFGLTSQGMSKAYFTAAARGTECYRAPEILCDHKVTEASDLWALGCIFFELYCRTKAFWDDQEVCAYYNETGPKPSVGKLDDDLDDRLKAYVSELVSNLLGREWPKRPSAKELRHVLKNLSEGRDEVYMTNPEFSGCYVICDARPSDDLWKSLKWKRYWYIS